MMLSTWRCRGLWRQLLYLLCGDLSRCAIFTGCSAIVESLGGFSPIGWSMTKLVGERLDLRKLSVSEWGLDFAAITAGIPQVLSTRDFIRSHSLLLANVPLSLV